MSLERIGEFLNRDGAPIPGCCDVEADGVELAKQSFPGKPYCTVRQWVLIDLDTSEEMKVTIAEKGFHPVLLYAHEVVFDSRGRFLPGDWVRSTLLVELRESCLFETENTVYILLGDGARKQADPSIVTSIF